ncbi:unnamed protein product [Effrenium voratum]|nr:unnamed protein product [Effrenium voratum]
MQLDLVAANAANPKSQGPFTLPGPLLAQVMAAAMAEKPGLHRGWVIGGFPMTTEEAVNFFADMPVPAEPPKKGKEAELVLDDLKFKEHMAPDLLVVVQSAEEVCQARANASESKPYVEKEFVATMDQWKKDKDALPELFGKMGAEPVTVSADLAAEAERQKHEADVKAAEEEEREVPPLDESDLVVLASSSWSWLEGATAKVSSALEGRRPVFNFLAPTVESPEPSKVESVVEEVVNEAPNEEKLRAEQRVEHVKKEELARLEKHSEPLRLYLMKFVVPALTGALVEVCHEQPEDPVGYLAEYLALYAEVSKERRAESR